MAQLIHSPAAPVPSVQAIDPLRDVTGSPLWQQSLALEQGCADLLRKTRPGLSLRDWERLANGIWPLHRQIADAFRLDERHTILERLATAQSTVNDLRVSLHVFSQQPELAEHAAALAYLTSLAGACARQLEGWTELLTPRPPDAPPSAPEVRASSADTHWNDAFALLVQLESPPPERTAAPATVRA